MPAGSETKVSCLSRNFNCSDFLKGQHRQISVVLEIFYKPLVLYLNL